jgi:hypothetical protein
VLFTFRSLYYPLSVAEEYLALGGGPPGFMRASTRLALLEKSSRRTVRCHLRDYHPLWSNFPEGSVTDRLCNSLGDPQSPRSSHNPPCTTPVGLHAEAPFDRFLHLSHGSYSSFDGLFKPCRTPFFVSDSVCSFCPHPFNGFPASFTPFLFLILFVLFHYQPDVDLAQLLLTPFSSSVFVCYFILVPY